MIFFDSNNIFFKFINNNEYNIIYNIIKHALPKFKWVWQACIFPSGGMIVSSLFIYFEKTRRLKFCSLKGKSVSILQPKKLEYIILPPIILAMLNVSHGKDNPTSTACLASFFSKDNYVIIMLKSTMYMCLSKQYLSIQIYRVFFQ